jgi:hypothetical protein
MAGAIVEPSVIRMPCSTCPWRRSVRARGFPGGIIDYEKLLRMVKGGANERIMQCHCSADSNPKVCVGFALQVGRDSAACRLAACLGLIDPERMETDEELHTLESVIRQHGGHPAPNQQAGYR